MGVHVCTCVWRVQVAVELMGLADHYGIDGLKILCESTLIHNVDCTNVCMFFRTAHRHDVRPDVLKASRAPCHCIVV